MVRMQVGLEVPPSKMSRSALDPIDPIQWVLGLHPGSKAARA